MTHGARDASPHEGRTRKRTTLAYGKRVIGLLPQSPVTPDGITVTELVSRGRFPNQGALL